MLFRTFSQHRGSAQSPAREPSNDGPAMTVVAHYLSSKSICLILNDGRIVGEISRDSGK